MKDAQERTISKQALMVYRVRQHDKLIRPTSFCSVLVMKHFKLIRSSQGNSIKY